MRRPESCLGILTFQLTFGTEAFPLRSFFAVLADGKNFQLRLDLELAVWSLAGRGGVRFVSAGKKLWPKFQRHERGWDLPGSSPEENKIILEGDLKGNIQIHLICFLFILILHRQKCLVQSSLLNAAAT